MFNLQYFIPKGINVSCLAHACVYSAHCEPNPGSKNLEKVSTVWDVHDENV